MAKTNYQVTGLAIGQQGSTGTTVYAVWNPFGSKKQKNIASLSITWWYLVLDSYGNPVWLVGQTLSVDKGASSSGVYTAPTGSKAVQIHVTPTLTKDGKKKATPVLSAASWSFAGNAPAKPSAPTVSVDGYSVTMRIQTSDEYANGAAFFLFRDNEGGPFWSTYVLPLSGAGIAETTITLEPNHRYHARVKLFNGPTTASEYSDAAAISELIIPDQVVNVVATPLSQAQIQVTWDPVAGAASTNGYEIEYATDPKYFSGSNATTTTVNTTTNYINVETGHVWYFRVRAKNSNGIAGAWSDPPASAAAASKPNPPTTWTLSNTACVGTTINLYWTHNTSDGSKPTKSQIELSKTGAGSDGIQIIEITHSLGPDDRDFTFYYALNLSSSSFSDGDVVRWRVRTQGVEAMGWSDYSVLREIRIYAPASLAISAPSTVTVYPINIGITVAPYTQSIVSFYLAIRARNTYDGNDYMGEFQHVMAGQIVYSKNYVDLNNIDAISLTPFDVILMNGQTYDIEAIVATSAGLTAEATTTFTINTSEPEYYLDMGITIDPYSLSAAIVPGCYDDVEEGDEGEDIYDNPVPGITLSVYRINFDGTFTLIKDNIENNGVTVISDPHPALDNGKYRLIAVYNNSGEMSFADIISEDLEVKGLVLQWDAKYTNYAIRDIVMDMSDVTIGNMAGGTTLKLPYNVKKNESSELDSELVEYIGREHPVSYYGTQKGQKSSYSADVPKDDLATLDALRRLQIWPGDVYIRSQDGLGYWAKVEVSFDRDYDSLVMPVNLDVVRVDSDRP